MGKKPLQTRRFDGKMYRLGSPGFHRRKGTAKAEARRHRNKVYRRRARVIKISGGWAVYYRKTRRSR